MLTYSMHFDVVILSLLTVPATDTKHGSFAFQDSGDVLQANVTMEHYLADVCNSMILNASVCQAFNYNPATNTAYFKGQQPSNAINYLGHSCVMPNTTLWVLSSGELQLLEKAQDTKRHVFWRVIQTSLKCTHAFLLPM